MARNVIILIAIMAIVLANAGCVNKNRNIGENKTVNYTKTNLSEVIPQFPQITDKENITPPPTPLATRTYPVKMNRSNTVIVKDMGKEDYTTVIVCVQNTKKEWGNVSPVGINDNAQITLIMPPTNLVIGFSDNRHLLFLGNIASELAYNGFAVIEVRQDCSKDLIEGRVSE